MYISNETSQQIKDRFIQVLNRIIELYRLPDTDVSWTSYCTPQEAIDDIQNAICLLKQNDDFALDNLSLLFAPTGDVQEISISSGWSAEYLEISARVDQFIAKLKSKNFHTPH